MYNYVFNCSVKITAVQNDFLDRERAYSFEEELSRQILNPERNANYRLGNICFAKRRRDASLCWGTTLSKRTWT